MIDAPRRSPPPADQAPLDRVVPGTHSCLGIDLHELAQDLAGPVDRDELTADEAAQLAEIVDEAVRVMLPRIADALRDELALGIESLPLHARLVLANARLRRLVGSE